MTAWAGFGESQKTDIIATIRPLALIARAVAPVGMNVSTLIPAAADPHTYQLKISERRALAHADLLVWLGGEFESFLVDVVDSRPNLVKITATELAGLHWGAPSGRAAIASHANADHHHHGAPNRDPHIWVDPANAKVIARAVAAALGDLRPDAREEIAANLSKWLTAVDEQTTRSRNALTPFAETGFGVVHDGYQHFNRAFGLNQLAAVLPTSNQRLSARKFADLQKQLRLGACLIADSDTGEARRLAHALGLPLVVADPLAADAGIDDYPAWLAQMTTSFVTCFQREAEKK